MFLDSSPLLDPCQPGDLTLPNRAVMAPLTRNRATPGSDARTVRYYARRASVGLIVCTDHSALEDA
jgi:N-ethylmaleimide reductase